MKTALGVATVVATAGCNNSDGGPSNNSDGGPSNNSDGGPSNNSGGEPTSTATPAHLASNYSDLQTAVEALGEGETLIVDETITLQETVSLKSNIRIVGSSGKIVAGDDTNADLLRPLGVTNVVIHGVEFDGNSRNNEGNRLIGGVDLEELSNLRITNCTFRGAALNAIELVDRQGGSLEDIYIGGNRFIRSNNHGIIMGVKGKNGLLKNVVVEGNTVLDTSEAQAIGIFGQDTSEARNSAVVNNVVDNVGDSAKYGTNIAFEERANNNIAYANRVLGNSASNKGGIGVTKDGDNNIIGNNYLSQNARTLQVQNLEWYEPEGPPRHNLVTRNHVESGNVGFFYARLKGDLHVSENLIENVGTVVNDSGENSGSNYTFYNNGLGVEPTKAGLPGTIGNAVRYTDKQDRLVGRATWNRGSIGTEQKVSVSVSTEV